MSWTKKHLLEIESLTAEEILTVLDTASRLAKRSANAPSKRFRPCAAKRS